MDNWNRVEDFRKRHGHLPSRDSAPCKACFDERTTAEIKVRELEDKLFYADDIAFQVWRLLEKGDDLRHLRESLEDYKTHVKPKFAEEKASPKEDQ